MDLLSRTSRGAWLINVARGALVDDRALVRRSRGIGGAVLDTLRKSRCRPTFELATPNSSRPTRRGPRDASSTASIELFCENLGRFQRGEPLSNLVDPSAGY